MTRTITAAVAAFGLVVSTAIASVIVVGLLEGISAIPDAIPPTAAVVVFIAGLALAGRVAVDVDPHHALRAVGATSAVVALGGLLAAQATESQGEAIEPVTVATLTVGLFALLAGSAIATRRLRRRSRRRLTSDGVGC
jgi:peptidoglycan/LPS O-acetylase OafA/YrhL